MCVYAKWYDRNQAYVKQMPNITAAYFGLLADRFEGIVTRVVVVRGYYKIGCLGRDVAEYDPLKWSPAQIEQMEGIA